MIRELCHVGEPAGTGVHIRPPQPAERSVLLALWERSVKATHGFLTEEDVAFYRPLTAEILAGDALELWVLTNESDAPIGFLGLAGHAIEALFLEPQYHRRGAGRRLAAHACALRGGALTVDVNEQNIAARAFYEALGFAVVRRSSFDDYGRPHALLHMRRDAAPCEMVAVSPQRDFQDAGPRAGVATPVYRITTARPRDLSLLPAIELAAARLLVGHAPQSVLSETTAEEILRAAQARGHLWVALAEDVPVGFARVEVLDARVAHLEELDVHPEHGCRGIGTRLVTRVCAWAAMAGYREVTLTTFREVPFNMPFYSRLGFVVIPPAELSPALHVVVDDESRRGLDQRSRVAMRYNCAADD